MNEALARAEICRVGRSLFERGYVHATAGNISVRLDKGLLITPTDACLGTLQPDQLALLDPGGRQLDGERASKSVVLHRAIYDALQAGGASAGCIIHTHSTHCVALTLEGTEAELLPPITPYFVMKVGHVPVLPYGTPGDAAVAQSAAAMIAAYGRRGIALRAVMMPRLGPQVWHDTPAQAMAVLEELEETARLWLLSARRAAPLEPAQIDALRQKFGVPW